jgi:4-coumarate--CoA ligase (photoactive yellow protein activation family)
MSAFFPAAPPWWRHAPSLQRVVADLLAAELAAARPGRPVQAPPWPQDFDLARALGADSLELMGMATALAEALHLDGADDRMLAAPQLARWIDAAARGLAADGSRLTFRTSGSSGSPKRCTHALAVLLQETRALAALFPDRRRILCAVPAHHIYGFLFTVLLPRALGIDTVLDLRGAGPAALAGMLRPGDLVVAHPLWWEALARRDPVFPADVAGTTSTAPCPDALALRLADAGLRLVQVYGSSETAGVGWRERADAPFALFPYWREAGQDSLARTMPDGTTQHYPLQDRLDWSAPDRFRPAGRIDHAVQVGGSNVFPAYVADVLKLHPQVLDAAVRLMRPDEGARLKAFEVARAGLDAAALADWCGARLATPERPAAFTFGTRLPRQAGGKPGDWIIDAE